MSSYELKTINIYAITLWDALKFEILNVQEEDLAEGALKALSMIAGRFAQQEGFLNAYTKPIMKECNQHLEDAPTKQSSASGRIMYALASAATPVADKITKGILPTLFTLYRSSESLTKRRGLLEVFNEIVRAYLDRFRLQPKLNLEELTTFGQDALGVMLRVLTNAPKAEVSLRLTALSGIAQLVALRGLLTEDQRFQAVDVVTDIVLHEHIQGHGDIRSEAIKTIAEMAHTAPDAIRNQAIPAFMVELPDSPADDSSYLPVLEAFAHLSSEQQVFDTVVLRLKNKYSVASAQAASKDYQQALLLAILYSFTHGSPMPDEEGVIRGTYFTDYVGPFLLTLLEQSQTGWDHRFTEIVGRLCNAILRPQGVHFQSQVYNKTLDKIAVARKDSDRMIRRAPFSLYYYAALRPDVIDAEDIVALLQSYAGIARGTSNNETPPVVLQHISLLVNKFIAGKAMQSTLESVGLEVGSLLSSPETSTNSIGVAFSVTKALLVQGKSPALTSKYLKLLLQLLSTPDGKTVAKHFATLLAPDEILTKENHCQVSGLYKQKTFSQLVPSLTAAVRTADPATKPNYLVALSGVLRWLPYSMLETSLVSLTPPLLQTLDLSSDQDAKASTLTIFESVLMHDPNTIAEHTASLVTRLLNCTTAPVNGARVRAKALQCLALVPKMLKREAVVPYRRQVVKKLMVCLDDGKREVRAEGVRCRSAWLGLDEVEEED